MIYSNLLLKFRKYTHRGRHLSNCFFSIGCPACLDSEQERTFSAILNGDPVKIATLATFHRATEA